jgi:hypothetical protein
MATLRQSRAGSNRCLLMLVHIPEYIRATPMKKENFIENQLIKIK